ncbi:C-4 sterol methyl oxidase [Clathrus columnatus]|uniref:C-4 sterol methyl oxidase n=1 Tax=Clathrus columnatus TaxID=1419009 RepID=A0AAV5AI18_9AGAM|nr:C-4 sterol methyl oxidase [Clathrus columnatus]
MSLTTLSQTLSNTLATSFTYLPSALPYIARTLSQASNGTLTASESARHYLESNIDFTTLSVFEQWWAAWYLLIGSHTIATGLMSFIMHEVVYFGRCVPWIIIDAIPYFRKWKLQPGKVPTPQEQWECTKLVLFSHFTIELPAIWFFHPLAEFLGMSTWQVPFPPWKTMALQVLFFFIFEDAFHYWAHRALHYGPLYKKIHKIHHKYSAPFGLAAEYAHPLEVFILGTGTLGGPILYCAFFHDLHVFAMYIWITLRLFQAIDAHSGYDFPWSLQHIFWLWSGADHHDFHHMAFMNNYSTSFRYLDYIFGTDDKYRAYKNRLSAEEERVNATEQKWKEQVEAEIEKEGLRAEREAEGKGWWGEKDKKD